MNNTKYKSNVGATAFLLILTLGAAILAQTPANSEIQKKTEQAKAIFAEGRKLADQGTKESMRASIPKFEQAQSFYRELNDNKNEFYCLGWLGSIYYTLNEKQKALDYYIQSLPLSKTVGDKSLEARTLSNIGRVYSSLSEKQKALDYYAQSLLLRKAVGDKRGEATTLYNIGAVYSLLGEKQKALDYYTQSLLLNKAVGVKEGEATTLNNIGSVYDDLGEKQKALDYYAQSLPLNKAIGDKSGEATTLTNIGAVYSDLGEKQKALDYYAQALPLYKAVSDKSGEATTLNNIGAVYSDLGEKQKALDYYAQSLPLSKAISDKRGEATTLNNIGAVFSDLGEKQKALDYYAQALLLRKAVGDKRGEANTLNNIGGVFGDLGEKQKALDYYAQALLLRKAVGDKSGEATTLTNIGAVFSDLGEKQKALDYFAQSLPLRKAIGDKLGEATTLNNIGAVYDSLGEKQKALDYYAQSLPLSKAVSDKSVEATTLTNIGAVFSDLGEKQKAFENFQASLPLSKAVGDKSVQAHTLNWMMVYWQSLNNMSFAVFYGKQSVNLFQKLRTNIQGMDKETQKIYLKSVELTYRRLADILTAQGRTTEALQVLNLLKDQQFFDFNRNPNEPIKQLGQTPRETALELRFQQSSEKINEFGEEIADLNRKIGTRQPTLDETAQLQELETDLKTASDEFLVVLKQAQIEFSKPADEKDKVGIVPDEVEMETALRNLNQQTGQKTVAVYTLVGEDNFRALIVSPDGIKAVSSPIKATELNDKALKLWSLLQSDKYDTTVLSKQIYDVVFAPIEKELPKDTTTIMWSLDGNLRYLPMAALFDGKQFLAERYNHVNFTRADSERLTRNVNPNWTGTGFGTSNAQTVELLGNKISFSALPGVTAELSEIFKQTNSKTGILTGEVLPDAKFTKTSFLDAMKRKRPVVHIASHFSFRPGDEARSFLLLGDGTAFTLNEMKAETNLFAGVDLLTLSACNTAAAQADANGREIDGFAELAQRLGAGAVMATLWSVSDASTPWLMWDFYATRQSQAGMTKAEALRKAQLELLGGTAETKPLPNAEKGAGNNKPQIVIVPKGGKRDGGSQTRSDVIYLDETEAPLYKKDDKKPFAHPYYWSPFILFGNWK